MTECDRDSSVPDWLIEHPEVLPILQELGVDYSCGGKSLEYACAERSLDVDAVVLAFRQAITRSRSVGDGADKQKPQEKED